MVQLFSVFLILGTLLCDVVTAQRPKPRTVPKPKVIEPIEVASPILAEYEYQCSINSREQVSCLVASPAQGKYLDVSQIGSAMRAVFTVGADRLVQELIIPKVVVEADSSLKMITLLTLLNDFRVAAYQVIEYKLSKEISLFLPRKPDRKTETNIKPNPLKLEVDVTKDGKLTLNLEPAGSLNESAPLTNKLIKIFKDREVNGVFRPGINEVEKTVSIVMPLEGYGIPDLQRIAEAIALAGGDRIVLDIDAYLDPVSPPSSLDLPPIPPKRKP